MTTINNFLSLSVRMCLMNVQPVPISTIVINKTAPFSLIKFRYNFTTPKQTQGETKTTNIQMRDVEQNSPRFHVLASDLDKMEINRMEQQRQRFEEHQHGHDVVNFENGMPRKCL